MKRLCYLLLVLLGGCGSNKTAKPGEESTFDYDTFSKRYTTAALPYQLSDTALLKNKDTARLSPQQIAPFVADSIKKKLFGKTTGIRFIPLQKVESKKGESYFITKVMSNGKTAALLTVFGKAKDAGASFAFLVPDADASTTQVSTIDNAFSISRNVSQKQKNEITVDGKDVYAYNSAINGFTLVLTDLLNEKAQDLINPIDTFAKKNKFSGDYVRDKKNIVSIRDGRNANELNMFVHFEQDGGDCTGELKGTLFFTSGTTAVYRQGGDPCALEFRFTPSAVVLREEEGCGSHRGMKCLFDGSFPRKGAAKQKPIKSKNSKK